MTLSQIQDDEVILTPCDLEQSAFGKRTMFEFTKYRQPEHYRITVDRVSAEDPEQ